MVVWKNAPDLSTPLDADHLTQAFDDERASERAHQSSTYAPTDGTAGNLQVGTGTDTTITSPRKPGTFGFPVTTHRPATASSIIAFDIMPSAGAADDGDNGFAWVDICDTDVHDNSNPVGTARIGIRAGWVEIGSRVFEGAATKPVHLAINGTSVITLNADLTVTMPAGPLAISAPAGYSSGAGVGFGGVTVSNSGAGASAFAQALVTSDYSLTTIGMRAYSSTFAADSGSRQYAVDIRTAAPGGLNIVSEYSAVSIKIISGGFGMSKTDAEFDPNGNVFLGRQAAVVTTAVNGFVSLPSMEGTPSGSPTLRTGLVPVVVDTTGSKLWARIGGTWKSVALA